jgi:endo-beta-N-acetylglucosaminidase D
LAVNRNKTIKIKALDMYVQSFFCKKNCAKLAFNANFFPYWAYFKTSLIFCAHSRGCGVLPYELDCQ